jgi:hypothetical protein
LKNDVNVASKSNKQNNIFCRLEGHWPKQDPEPDPNSLVAGTDQRIRIITKGSESLPKCYGSATLQYPQRWKAAENWPGSASCPAELRERGMICTLMEALKIVLSWLLKLQAFLNSSF